MKTVSQYREDIKSLMKKSADIDAQATAENRELTDAELLLKNEILDTVEDLNSQVVTLTRQDRMNALLDAPEAPVTVLKNKKIEAPKGDNKDRFASLGQQLVSIIKAFAPERHVDPRLYNAATGLGETVPSDGGLR